VGELLSMKDVARILRKGRHAVAAYAKEGKLTAVRFPDSKRDKFTREDVDAFIRRSRVGPEAGPNEETPSGQTADFQALSVPKRKRANSSKVLWYEQYARK
jgi:hypothetical protein